MEENLLSSINQSIQDNVAEIDEKYLTFWTDKQLFGVRIFDVVQIIQMQPITEIPEFPIYAKGIITLRGNMIPVIDVRIRFGKEETTYDEHTCIIVTNIQNNLIGLIVDGVEEVTDIAKSAISPPPKISSDYINTYLTGISQHNNGVILLLDAHRIITNGQLEMLQNSL